MPDSLPTLNTELLTCRKCPRLVQWREQVARVKRKAYQDQDYWGKPVPGFGDPKARVLVVGLAPGAHGSNRTGRQFTGDASGAFLYPALHRAGFISDVGSWSPNHDPGPLSRHDGLTLTDMYITPVCRCAPPANKPLPEEMDNCQPYLERELALIRPKIIVVLGRIAFDRVLRIMRQPTSQPSSPITFSHSAVHPLNTALLNTAPLKTPYGGAAEHWLVCSYHPSQQNTQTGRLTVAMFDSVWQKVKELLAAP